MSTPIEWRAQPAVPRAVAAALESLRFRNRTPLELDDGEWQQTFAFCDRSRLTLYLAPPSSKWASEEMERRKRGNQNRRRRLLDAHAELADALGKNGVEFAVLKGITLWDACDGDARQQYDIDLYCPPASLPAARDSLLALGYQPLQGMEDYPTDHLPVMVRPNTFQWRGDYFDPEIPLSIDLHFRLWGEIENVAAPSVDAFWERRTNVVIDGQRVTTLHPVDSLGYCCLHLLRHLLQGNLQPSHVYELARFVHHRARDVEFWDRWREWHADGLRSLEAISIRLAADWFGCELAPQALTEIQGLPGPVQDWFSIYGASPLVRHFRPNKDEIWLHYNLLRSTQHRVTMLRRRLFPPRLPRPAEAVREGTQAAYLKHVCSRMFFHARALASVVRSGVRWALR